MIIRFIAFIVFKTIDLTRLEIRNRKTKGFITDECFDKAFRHMRLKYFLVESFQVSLQNLTAVWFTA